MTLYGFELENKATVQIDALTMREAIEIAEAQAGGYLVTRGRSLDGFDNDAPDGHSDHARDAFKKARRLQLLDE